MQQRALGLAVGCPVLFAPSVAKANGRFPATGDGTSDGSTPASLQPRFRHSCWKGCPLHSEALASAPHARAPGAPGSQAMLWEARGGCSSVASPGAGLLAAAGAGAAVAPARRRRGR